MTSRRTGRHSAMFAMVFLLAFGGPLMAQDASIVLGRRDRGPFLTLDPFKGSVQLNGVFDYETSASSGGTVESNSMLFQQSLSLSTGGGVVSHNFLEWHASVTLGLTEQWDQTTTESGSTMGLFHAYDLQATILRSSDLPVGLFARRGESYINRAFAALLRNTTTAYGGSVDWRNGALPMTLRVSHTNTIQEDLTGNTQYILDEDQLEYQTEYEPSDSHRFTFNYEFNGINQNNPAILNNVYRLQNATLTHDWNIDPERRFVLSQYVNYTDQTGAFPYAHLRLSEYLRMRLAENLEGNVNYNYNRQTYSTTESQGHNVSAGLSHHLFESLTTTVQGGMSTTRSTFTGTQSGDSSTDTYFGSMGVNYTKKIAPGRFSAHLGLGLSQSDNSAVGATQQVIGDVQTFSDPQPITLTRSGISAPTIAVFDAAGTRLFVEGVDYEVDEIANTLQIRRLTGGNINDGDVVRLNYDVLPLPGYEARTTTLSGGVRYDFQEGPLTGLSLFGNYSQVSQIISPPTSRIRADNVRDTTLGATYRVWKLSFSAEQKWRQSDLAPFDSLRFSARYSDRLGDRTSLLLSATQSFVHYSIDDTRSSLTTLDGRMEYAIARDLKASLSARWRYDDNSRLGRTMGFEEQGEIRWTIRQTDLLFLMRHTSLDTSSTGNNSFLFQFGITRNF